MTVAGIIPSFNGEGWLIQSLPGIVRECTRVIVVDGGSTDDSKAICEKHGAEFVTLDGNPGFAAACNKGAMLADTDMLLFLNNDIHMKDGAVAALLGAVAPDVGLIGAAGAFFTTLYGFADETIDSTARIDYVPFWCAMTPRSLFEQLGGLDEKFGMGYSEDADYAIRVERAGYRVICTGAEVTHMGGGGQTAAAMGYDNRALADHCIRNIEYLKTKHRLPRILVVRLDAFGDVLMTACAVKKLRGQYPSSRIFWLCRPECHDAVAMCDCADVILEWGKPSVGKILETERFDLLYNFNDYPLDTIVNLRIKGKRIYGSYVLEQREPEKGTVQRVFEKRTWRVGKEMTTQRDWHARVAHVRLDSEVPPISKRFCLEHSVPLPADKPLIAFNGGSSGDAKSIPVVLAYELIARLNHCGYRVVLIGAMNHDLLIAEECAELDIVNLICKTRFLNVPGIISRCKGTLCTDSAIRHVSVGCGVPSMAFFTAADSASCGSYKGHVDLQADIWCSPCWEKSYDFTCPMQGFAHLACWRMFDPDAVIRQFLALVEK